MLKFLRRYQKWMLVIFCAGLMIAFTAQPVMELFMPQGGKKPIGQTADGSKITQEDIQTTNGDLQRMRRLGMDPFPGIALVPNTGEEQRDALSWILIQRAAEENGLKAGRSQAFSLVANLTGAQDETQLEEKAREMGVNGEYLIQIGQQYLLAEQFRQLVQGIEYAKPVNDEQTTGSPGLRRFQAANTVAAFIQQLQSDQRFLIDLQLAQFQGRTQQQVLEERLMQEGSIGRIQGHSRVTADEIRHMLQSLNAEVDLTVALLDAAAGAEDIQVDDAFVQSIFERYAGDDPGTGEPYRLGYRVPPRVKLEALRFPIDAARDVVAKDVTPEDIRTFYQQYRSSFMELPPVPAEGEAPAPQQPQRLTAEQRDEIRTILIEVKARELVEQLAQQARQRLNEDARGLDDDGAYKKLPDDFSPTPLVQVASEIEQQYGIAAELVVVAELTSSQDILDAASFSNVLVGELPKSSVRLPDSSGVMLREVEIHQAVLGGKDGLFATFVPQLNNGRFADYINFAKPLIDQDSPAAEQMMQLGLQPKLPGQYLRDITGSTYIFRITDADPAHPAPELGPIVEQVTEDAKKVKAYEALVEGKEAMLTKAADVAITALTEDQDAVKTFSGLSRRGLVQRQVGFELEGVDNAGAVLLDAFNTVDGLVREGGVETASQAERVFAVELAGDYKLAVVRVDDYRPMTRASFEAQAQVPAMLLNTSASITPNDIEPPMSLEALIKYTGFVPADGQSIEDFLAENDEEEDLEDVDASEEDEPAEDDAE